MQKSIELKLLKSIKTGKGLINLIVNLKLNRKNNKEKNVRRSSLTPTQRQLILSKTNAHCHICGIELINGDFQADHVKPHSSGGLHLENNYLPACSICNNYRWHYSPEELQIILKIGVWAKTKMVNDPVLGIEIANNFVKHEMGVRKRRASRNSKGEG